MEPGVSSPLSNLLQLENYVYMIEVKPLEPNPCPFSTQDPKYIYPIQKTTVWNVKITNAIILSRIIFLPLKTVMCPASICL